MRRLLPVIIFCAVMLAHGGRAVLAQVRLAIPFPAGGGSEIIGRLIQPMLAETLGQQLLIRNVGGAAGTIGTAEVVRARPDDQTLLLTSPNLIALIPSYRPSTPYRAEQLVPICMVANAPSVMMTPQISGIRTMADLIAWARAQPGGVPVVSTPGGQGHLALSAIERQERVQFNHIPFRGSGDAVLAMQQGSVVLMIAEANLVKQYGLHPIGVLAEQREVGNGLEVRLQVSQQPDHLDISMSFDLQPAARANPVEVAVDVKLQQILRGIARTPGQLRRYADDTRRRQI